MNITGVCPYETPCGWCAKWDKECDKKMYKSEDKLAATPGDVFTVEYLNPTLIRGCDTCAKKGWDMPECRECNKKNDYKWYERQDSLVTYINTDNEEKH